MTDRTAPRATVSVERHNAVLDAATARAEKLVDRLAAAVRPILEEAGVRAARAFEAKATDFLTAAGPGVTSASTMVCVKPRPEEAAALALPGGLDAETLHVTLAYLGEVEGDLAAVVEALAPVAASLAPLEGIVGGAGYFGDGTEGPAILLPDVPGLVELRVRATEALAAAEIEYGRDHGFEAHITVAYFDETTDDVADPVLGGPLHFDSLLVVRGDVVEADLPLVGIPAVTAAGQPPWSAPGADEVVDVDSLVAQIRAKTDPVRNAMLETTMTPALRQAGLGFDVTNPLTAKVLAQSGSQVTNIAETTQLNVMRTIRASYANGLSIPQTADVIRAGMAAAAGPRATLIARTELAGVVNGGSLAATKIVAGATGDSYVKKWLTAPGAPNPRHELVDGLDGQTQPLDGYFDVEGAQLEYPGDPGGPPEEVCNCRCGAPWVAISGRAWAASRRVYEGQLVRVVTAGGRELAVTPNHPILTGRGWVAAGLLEEGDDLVCRRHSDIPSGCPDVDDVPAEAQERFASLQLAATRREWVSGGAMNFHGDVAEGEVEVVGADDALPLEDVSPLGEHLRELALSLAHREMGLDGYASALLGDPEAKTVRLSAAAPLNTRPLDDPRDSPSSDAEATREREFALACSVTLNDARSDLSVGVIEGLPETVGAGPSDTAITEILPYGHRSEAALVCDLLVAHSRFVELDPVIDLSRIDYAGHVFNFSTKTGTYLMGGIVSANCTLVYDTPDGEQEADAEEPPDLSSAEGGDASGLGFGVPTPAAVPAAPVTLAPADVVSIQGGTRGALVARRQTIEATNGELAKLVALPDRANLPSGGLPVTMRKNQTSRGHIKTASVGGRHRPIEINISSDQHPAITYAHEFGHLLDLSYIGDTSGVFATQNLATSTGELGSALRELDDAWKASRSYQALDALPAGDRAARYYKSRAELWARSFSQYAAERSGQGSVLFDELQRELASQRSTIEILRDQVAAGGSAYRIYPEFWDQGDFDRISAAIDRVLRAAGLAVPPPA